MKTYALFQQYIWLVNTIHKAENGITLEEINQRWLANEASEGIPIARSTFNLEPLNSRKGDGTPLSWKSKLIL